MTTKAERAEQKKARQRTIIDQARTCFEMHGLHGTSMVDIARATGLGPGQIYRCFNNKEAIVEAIVQSIIEQRVERMLRENDNPELKAGRLAEVDTYTEQENRDNFLLMEINAESSRNPRLHQILTDADQRLFSEGVSLMKQRCPQLSDAQLLVLSEFHAVLTEGTIYRRRVTPVTVNRALLQALYRKVFTVMYESG